MPCYIATKGNKSLNELNNLHYQSRLSKPYASPQETYLLLLV